MRRRAIQLASISILVAVLLMGIPAIIFAVNNVRDEMQQNVDERAKTVAQIVDARVRDDYPITWATLEPHTYLGDEQILQITYLNADGDVIRTGVELNAVNHPLVASTNTRSGGVVTVEMSRTPVVVRSVYMVAGAILLILIAYTIGILVALRQSRRLSAPLIYLAASAEQVGAGQVRPKMKPSGIEEIDLVSQELERTADRVAGRIAAERQFAAAAAHQLRTPLTALSMRIEEIQYLSTDPDISEEADKALEQIERLGGVVNELMASAKERDGASVEAITIDDIFHQQQDEWAQVFHAQGRELKFKIETDSVVLATPGSLAQILATLIENSLKYGDGTTTVRASKSAHMVSIKVSDEGPGVAEDLAPYIFKRGVSAGGSTGIGLAVAKELAESVSGRLELTARDNAEFTLTVRAAPPSIDPHRLVPQGASYTVGARRRRR